MKKIILSLLVVVAFGMGHNAKAQNCQEIVQPFFDRYHIDASTYPMDKLEWRCYFSHCAFYTCDEVPTGAKVFNITQLTHVVNGQHPAANYIVDLDHISYWAYNFLDFQAQDYYNTIFFETPASPHRYLALRSYDETMDRANNPDKYIK